MADSIEIVIEGDGTDLFVLVDGVRIAKRGHPGTPQAKTWVSLEPGWVVRNSRNGKHIEVEYAGARIQ